MKISNHCCAPETNIVRQLHVVKKINTRGMVWGGRCEGGFRMGNTCTPVVDACRCMAKPTQYCKVKINK